MPHRWTSILNRAGWENPYQRARAGTCLHFAAASRSLASGRAIARFRRVGRAAARTISLRANCSFKAARRRDSDRRASLAATRSAGGLGPRPCSSTRRPSRLRLRRLGRISSEVSSSLAPSSSVARSAPRHRGRDHRRRQLAVGGAARARSTSSSTCTNDPPRLRDSRPCSFLRGRQRGERHAGHAAVESLVEPRVGRLVVEHVAGQPAILQQGVAGSRTSGPLRRCRSRPPPRRRGESRACRRRSRESATPSPAPSARSTPCAPDERCCRPGRARRPSSRWAPASRKPFAAGVLEHQAADLRRLHVGDRVRRLDQRVDAAVRIDDVRAPAADRLRPGSSPRAARSTRFLVCESVNSTTS